MASPLVATVVACEAPQGPCGDPTVCPLSERSLVFPTLSIQLEPEPGLELLKCWPFQRAGFPVPELTVRQEPPPHLRDWFQEPKIPKTDVLSVSCKPGPT